MAHAHWERAQFSLIPHGAKLMICCRWLGAAADHRTRDQSALLRYSGRVRARKRSARSGQYQFQRSRGADRERIVGVPQGSHGRTYRFRGYDGGPLRAGGLAERWFLPTLASRPGAPRKNARRSKRSSCGNSSTYTDLIRIATCAGKRYLLQSNRQTLTVARLAARPWGFLGSGG
jgi:hypothetical protein